MLLLAGALQALATAAPWDGQPRWWLQVLALAVLVLLIDPHVRWPRDRLGDAHRPGRDTWCFALGWLTATFWWLFTAMNTYGGLPAVLAVLAVLALAGVLAVYYGLACALWARVATANRLVRAVVFAACWTGAELARGTWLTGFPWGAVGYAHVDGPLAVFAPWIGVYGLGFGAAVLAALLAGVFQGAVLLSKQTLATGVVLAILVPWLSFNAMTYEPTVRSGRLSVALLQGNIPQDEKFEPGLGVPLALNWYGEQARIASAALVVAPETAVPLLPHQLPEGYWDTLRRNFSSGGQALLVGIPMGNHDQGYTNSVLGLRPGLDLPYRYDKHHLVPFGEFIPPFFRWFTAMMNIPLGDFNRGSLTQPTFDWQGQRLAPHICYEDLFGEELAMRFADPALAPSIFVNVSNIGWFGDGVAIDQHLQIARMRALEFERPFLRATNTGATVIIDHRGRVTHSLARSTRAVLVGEVEGRKGLSPYARWVGWLGLWPIWLVCAALVMSAGWWSHRRALMAADEDERECHP